MIEGLTVLLVLSGLIFFLVTAIGVIRFPDFFSRMHAAGKGDTLSTMLILGGLALYNLSHFSVESLLVSIKILFIAVFIFVASPTAAHAIIDAGYEYGEKPWRKKREGGDP